MNIKDKFIKTKAKINKLRAEAKEEASKVFKEAAAEIFDKFPQLESFSWTQYTPYFNDGEACHFSTGTDDFNINGEERPSDNHYNPTTQKWEKIAYTEDDWLPAADSVISELLGVFDTDDYEAMFGDHAKVTVTRAGVTTKEYDHD